MLPDLSDQTTTIVVRVNNKYVRGIIGQAPNHRGLTSDLMGNLEVLPTTLSSYLSRFPCWGRHSHVLLISARKILGTRCCRRLSAAILVAPVTSHHRYHSIQAGGDDNLCFAR